MTDKARELQNDKTVEALKILIQEISKKYDASFEEILYGIKEKEQIPDIPITLFENNAGYLELISMYCKDILGYSFQKISSLLNRDQRTIWTSYHNCKEKIPEIKLEKTNILIPLGIFSERKFSTFENLVLFLKKNNSIKEISSILKKDYKTVWTALSRARKKKNETK